MKKELEIKILEKFEVLKKEGREILRKYGFDGSRYANKFPDDVDYRRYRAECLNLIKRACGVDSEHYAELKALSEKQGNDNSFYFKDVVGILEAAAKDFEGGFLFDLKSLVLAELLGDFMEQAKELYKQGYHVPAASLAGAVLEES